MKLGAGALRDLPLDNGGRLRPALYDSCGILPFDLLQVYEQSFEVTAEFGIELSAGLASFFNDRVFHDSAVHELLRSIDQRWLKAMTPADGVNTRNRDRIRYVGAVPSQKIVESVYRSSRDVQRIFVRFPRNAGSSDQSSGKIESFARNVCKAQFSRDSNARSRQDGIASFRFAQHNRRNVKFKVFAPCLPPFARKFLIRSDASVLAWPRDQIADDARFDVHRGKHEQTLTDRKPERKYPAP